VIDNQVRTLSGVLAFMRALWAVDHGLRSLSKRMHERLGITGPQRLAIRMVGRFPSMTAGDLAEILLVHPSTLTGILDRLERQGLLTKRADPVDGRRTLLRLTARGAAIDRERTGTVEACVRRALADVPEGKVAAAREVLERIAAELRRG
jgi:DNA-binding MarR family transcriptional regulator